MTHIHALSRRYTSDDDGGPSILALPRPSAPPVSLSSGPVPSPPVVLRYLLVPSRSRDFLAPADPPARGLRPGGTANDDSHARFVHVPMRDASRW